MSQLLPIYTAEQLFAQCRLDSQLSELRTLAGLDTAVFDLLVKKPVFQFAELVQLAPASESHHHSGPGGLLKHTLDVITLALKKRRGYQLPIAGSLTEISSQRHLWTYAIFIGCLLHDIGKLSASTRLILVGKDGTEKSWTPHSGAMTQHKNLKGYRIEFRKTPYHYHAHLALTHWDLVPKEARTWLIEATNIMGELTAWLWGDKFESGTIGDIVEAADRESTAKDLQLPSDSSRFSNAIPAIDRYLKIIRHWIQDNVIKINTNGGMGWVDDSGHIYLVCRSLAEKLRDECNSQGLKNLPQDPVRIYDILQEHGYALSTEEGKAIWPIRVKTNTYEHKFTCLKFEARKLTLPSRPLKALDGEITLVGEDTQAAAPITQESANETVNKPIPETAAPITEAAYTQENEQIAGGEKITAETAETEKQIDIDDMPSDAEIMDAIASQDSAQETAPIRDTIEELAEAAHANKEAIKDTVETENTQVSGKAATETGAIAENVGLIRNLEFEAPDTAVKFLAWLQRGLLEKTILINNNSAEVHIVEEGVFLLAPAIFKTFLRLHNVPEEKHKNLSKRFANLRKHIRNGDVNIHPYWVKSSSRASKINGWVVPFNVIYENDHPIPKPNKFIKKQTGLED